MKKTIVSAYVLAAAALFCAAARADDSSTEELAKKLQNPVAPIINVPIQNNYNWNVGPEHDGSAYTLRLQPVIPLPFDKEYAVVSRTILPFTSQDKIIGRDNAKRQYNGRTGRNRHAGRVYANQHGYLYMDGNAHHGAGQVHPNAYADFQDGRTRTSADIFAANNQP
ncbi:MAG: hypothetical protein PHW69_08820 [Elusimicrobiaceae bacterium]|nr:hypothetical protein [Elusimicrobiaceae bacterium]